MSTRLDGIGGRILVDTRPLTASLAALNAEVLLDFAGCAAWTAQITGTFAGTLVFEATVDGTNYFAIPVMNYATEIYVLSTTAVGIFQGEVSAFKRMRVRCSAYTSGAAVVALRSSLADSVVYSKPVPITSAGTNLSVANTAGTLTLASPGTGLFHYLCGLEICRINNSAAAVVGTALLAYTTTNLPGALAFSTGNALAVGESRTDVSWFPTVPIKSSASGTATTIVGPAAGAGVQVRITALYYVGQ
jgi:hypothetical protein